MKAGQLRVGDRIRIFDVAGRGKRGFYLHPDTRRVYRVIMARGRAVRISEIDELGTPWYRVRIRGKDGRMHHHSLAVYDSDENWRVVGKSRATPRMVGEANKQGIPRRGIIQVAQRR